MQADEAQQGLTDTTSFVQDKKPETPEAGDDKATGRVATPAAETAEDILREILNTGYNSNMRRRILRLLGE